MAISLDELYSDPDWMLQAGMADIEHEQFMYDQIMYGGPSDELSDIERSQLAESLRTRLYDYDELALMGLRKHTMEGPMRYIYDDEQKKRRLEKNYWGQADVDDPFDPDDDPRTRIDINLPEIIKQWNPSQGTLQDFISGVYRHEYKHPLWDQHLGIRKNKPGWFGPTDELSKQRSNLAFHEKYGRNWDPGEPQHVAIRATGALYDKSSQLAREDYNEIKHLDQKGLGWVSDLKLRAKQDAERAGMLPSTTGEFWKHDQHPHKYPDQFNRGGIVSLMV